MFTTLMRGEPGIGYFGKTELLAWCKEENKMVSISL